MPKAYMMIAHYACGQDRPLLIAFACLSWSVSSIDDAMAMKCYNGETWARPAQYGERFRAFQPALRCIGNSPVISS